MEAQPQTLSPWLTIWVKPRETIRRIVDSDPQYQVIVLTVLAGFAESLNRASAKDGGDTFSLPVIFIICAIPLC